MGGSSSRISSGTLASPQTYAQASAVAKQLPDEILRLMFASAEFKDLLDLSSISGCSRYVFTTAKSLSTLFSSLSVEPQEQANGQILFAPIPELIPGVKKNVNAEERQRIALRNNLCLQIAYYYVRIFQVYAALALSVLDTNPTRTMSVKETSRLMQQGQKEQPQKGPRKAIFQSGGERLTIKFATEINKTPFAILVNYIDIERRAEDTFLRLQLRGAFVETQTSPFEFLIQWNAAKAEAGEQLTAYYKPKDSTEYTELNVSITGYPLEPVLLINGQTAGKFKKATSPSTGWVAEDGQRIFLQTVREIAEEYTPNENTRPARAAAAPGQAGVPAAGRAAAGVAYAAPLGTTVQGKPSFEKFDDVKRLYEKRLRGDEFPKAYAVGRAMILLQPIFDQEKTKQTPFFSQICRRVYDFDPQNFMPRSGVIASANIYMKSLVALYYDDFKLVGTQPVFSQTETGATELRTASQQIAKLFRIDKTQNTFISTAQVQFAQYPVCTAKGGDVLLQITEQKKSVLLPTIRSIIARLLHMQEEHNKQVNELLKKMFVVKNKELSFSDTLKKGGIDAVNVFAREARELLRQYYLKSEALFTMGVLAFDDSQSELTGLKVS